jgi:hypothetical protein
MLDVKGETRAARLKRLKAGTAQQMEKRSAPTRRPKIGSPIPSISILSYYALPAQRSGSMLPFEPASRMCRISVCKSEPCMLQPKRMDKTLRKYTSFDEAKADEYRYWQSRPAHERMAAVSEITQELYAMKGAVPDVPRLQRTLVHVKRPQS